MGNDEGVVEDDGDGESVSFPIETSDMGKAMGKKQRERERRRDGQERRNWKATSEVTLVGKLRGTLIYK